MCYMRLAAVMGLAAGLSISGTASQAGQNTTGQDFVSQEIETGLAVGYGVLLVDVNGDGRLDIVAVDTTRVLWYENPSWKRHIIVQGQTKPDNVCVAAHDIDRDGKLDLALGADWKGINPRVEGTIYWLRQGKNASEPWTLLPIGAEPTVHRIRFTDLDGDGQPELVAVPLLGRRSTASKNWMDGPVRTVAFKIPRDPARDRWVPESINESLHVVHNFWPVRTSSGNGTDLLFASYEGVTLLTRNSDSRWESRLLGEGNQERPTANRGASEIKQGKLANSSSFIGTIEPWHGHEVVVYTPPPNPSLLWSRQVLDNRLRWGHAVWCADLDGDDREELIIGVRDDLSQTAGERRGIRIYRALDPTGRRWGRTILENGGVAVEDLAAADLDADGRVDIVAAGRQTHNIRIYWNKKRR